MLLWLSTAAQRKVHPHAEHHVRPIPELLSEDFQAIHTHRNHGAGIYANMTGVS